MSLGLPSQNSSSSTYSPGESASEFLACSHCLLGMACVIEVVVRVVNRCTDDERYCLSSAVVL